MDVKTTFLNESLDDTTYMVQPEGFSAKVQERRCVSCKSPFMDLSRHLGLGALNLTNRSTHLDSSNVLMSLVCIRGAEETWWCFSYFM